MTRGTIATHREGEFHIMDTGTVIGLVSGIGLVSFTVLLGGNPGVFWSIPSLLLVVGGTFAATFLNYPLRDVLSMFTAVKKAFIEPVVAPQDLIEKLVSYAAVARRDGVLALEGRTRLSEDPFFERGMQMAIDGTAPELIKDMLSVEITFMEDRHALGQSILIAMGTYAPAFGMIGTLIGLVQMLSVMSDPSRIGYGMAVAILTTLYGALLANLLFLPAAGKLRVRTANEVLDKEIMIEGIISIQSGDNPRVVEQKLKSFVAPDVRRRIRADRGGIPRA